jgi:hypothetical protein
MPELKCRRCGKPAKNWSDWELCPACGYRYNFKYKCSPDDPSVEIPSNDNTIISGMSDFFFSQFYTHACLIAKKKFCIWSGFDEDGHSVRACYHCNWDPKLSQSANAKAAKQYTGLCEVSFYGPEI